jgi:hypothetical protein
VRHDVGGCRSGRRKKDNAKNSNMIANLCRPRMVVYDRLALCGSLAPFYSLLLLVDAAHI